jgi:hypothetical protein
MLGPSDGAPPEVPYRWTRDPAGPGWVTWLPIGPGATPPEALERLHWIAAMNRHLTAVLPKHAHRLLTTPVVHGLLAEAEAHGYDHELERYVSVPELRLVFQALVRQGLRLEPAPMLESLLTTVLAELAGRALPPPELEKIARQLPVFPTGKLVGIVRRGLGLSPEPAPAFGWPSSAPPAPVPQAVAIAEAWPWHELCELARASKGDTIAAIELLRALVPAAWRRTGYGLRWSLYLPLQASQKRLVEVPADLAARARESGQLAKLHGVIDRQLDLVTALNEIEAALAAPGVKRLSDAARRMLDEPDFPGYRWLLREPGRMLDDLGARAWAQGCLTERGQAGI